MHQEESENMTSYFKDSASINSVTEQQTVSNTVNKQCTVPPFTCFVSTTKSYTRSRLRQCSDTNK